MALLEIAAINCYIICQIRMRDGSLFDVKDSGSFKAGDIVMLSDDNKSLCRPMCPISDGTKDNIIPSQPDYSNKIRGLW